MFAFNSLDKYLYMLRKRNLSLLTSRIAIQDCELGIRISFAGKTEME